MSFQQRDMVKPGLDCATQTDAKPFSIRNFASISRQKNIAQSWPFSEKYLKLCLNHGISNMLPPLETHSFAADGLHGRSVAEFSMKKKKEAHPGIEKHKTEKKISKCGEDYVFSHLCGKFALLSLSNGDSLFGHQQPLPATLDPRISGNQSSCKPPANLNKGVKRKGRRKTKSLAEILAVAKHCVLDSHGRIRISNGGSAKSQVQNAAAQRERKAKYLASKAPESKQDCSLIKKHQRHDDFVSGMFQFSKRSRTMGVSNYRYKQGRFESWERKDSCRTDETEKAGGYERRFLETTSSISVIKRQEHHAY